MTYNVFSGTLNPTQSVQTDNHASTSSLIFTGQMLFLPETQPTVLKHSRQEKSHRKTHATSYANTAPY